MTEKEIIKLLQKQNARLLTILEKFAEKDTNIVVNSYNGAASYSTLDDSEEHKETISNSTNNGYHTTNNRPK